MLPPTDRGHGLLDSGLLDPSEPGFYQPQRVVGGIEGDPRAHKREEQTTREGRTVKGREVCGKRLTFPPWWCRGCGQRHISPPQDRNPCPLDSDSWGPPGLGFCGPASPGNEPPAGTCPASAELAADSAIPADRQQIAS